VRLGRCLPVLALLGLMGCAEHYRGDGRYGGYADRLYAYPYGGSFYRPYAYPFGEYDRGWRGRDRDDRKRHARDGWKERRYERLMNNGRPGDAERFNDRLCRNGVPGDAPVGC
jgi:hypothetical protein